MRARMMSVRVSPVRVYLRAHSPGTGEFFFYFIYFLKLVLSHFLWVYRIFYEFYRIPMGLPA